MLYEFKAGLNAYYSELSGTLIKDMGDVIHFNKAHAREELGIFRDVSPGRGRPSDASRSAANQCSDPEKSIRTQGGPPRARREVIACVVVGPCVYAQGYTAGPM